MCELNESILFVIFYMLAHYTLFSYIFLNQILIKCKGLSMTKTLKHYSCIGQYCTV